MSIVHYVQLSLPKRKLKIANSRKQIPENGAQKSSAGSLKIYLQLQPHNDMALLCTFQYG